MGRRGRLHHLEIWLDAPTKDDGPWSWLLQQLGYLPNSAWETGRSWSNGDAYVVLESGADHAGGTTDRRRSGLNHVAFWAGTSQEVDALTADAAEHGWTLMFPAEHPYAGGRQHYAAYLEEASGFEVELVADES